MIFDNPFFTEMLLPFLLVFVVVFAILQKSKILGDGKAQIDAIVSLVIGLLLIIAPFSRDFIVRLMPLMVVGVAVILVFLILYGFVAGDLTEAPPWMKTTFGILAGIFVIAIVLYVSGFGASLVSWINGSSESSFWTNALMVILIAGAMAVAIFSGKKKKKEE